MTKALIIVDPQVDFAEGGSLAVPGATQIYKDIAKYVIANEHQYELILLTRDDHINPGSHWSETPDYKNSWPVHCERGTKGWEFHPKIIGVAPYIDAVFCKGQYSAAYSGFEGRCHHGCSIEDWLDTNEIDEIVVVGNEFSNCVRATAVDGAKLGYKVTVLYDLCAKLHDNNTETFIEFDKYGILGG